MDHFELGLPWFKSHRVKACATTYYECNAYNVVTRALLPPLLSLACCVVSKMLTTLRLYSIWKSFSVSWLEQKFATLEMKL